MDSRSIQRKDAEGSDHSDEIQRISIRDHKEQVVDLLKRVTRISVATMEIIDSMRAEKR
jgi:predicted helicase